MSPGSGQTIAESGNKTVVACAVKSHMRTILDINLPSRAQPIVKLVPGGRASRHFRRGASAY